MLKPLRTICAIHGIPWVSTWKTADSRDPRIIIPFIGRYGMGLFPDDFEPETAPTPTPPNPLFFLAERLWSAKDNAVNTLRLLTDLVETPEGRDTNVRELIATTARLASYYLYEASGEPIPAVVEQVFRAHRLEHTVAEDLALTAEDFDTPRHKLGDEQAESVEIWGRFVENFKQFYPELDADIEAFQKEME